MLIQFTVENFCSLKDETTLSLLASKDKEHEDCLLETSHERVLPTIAIYGANASGKTTIIKAMNAAIMTIITSNHRQLHDALSWIVPFAFDQESRKKLTHFDFIFMTHGKKYQYGFLADGMQVYEEYLYEYKTARETLIFERINVNEYKFNRQYKKVLQKLVDKNTPNKLFLATATSWNAEITRDAYLWFANNIKTYDNHVQEQTSLLDIIENEEDVIKPFIKTLMKNADINVVDYEIESSTNNIYTNQIHTGKKTYEVSMIHKKINEDGKEDSFCLPLSMESTGTKQLFFLAPIIKHALDCGKAIVIDDFDYSFHPLLMDYLITIFHNKENNPNHAQLLFTTTSTEMLSLDTFRRDQVYFTEINHHSNVTELYSLDKFSVRKTENIRKGYLQGRYGAIPIIGSLDL